MSPDFAITRGAAALRQDFDESFAHAAHVAAGASEDFLAIRLRGDPHALRQSEIARLLRFRDVLRYPAAAAGWLGLAGVAGSVVPVYDLGELAGYAPLAQPPIWLVLCAAAPLALAFDAFEGHFRMAAVEGPSQRDVLHAAGESRPLLSIVAMLESVRSHARPAASFKEP